MNGFASKSKIKSVVVPGRTIRNRSIIDINTVTIWWVSVANS